MQLLMGIDGGGSNLRVAICQANLTSIVEVKGGATNPNSVGRVVAQDHIRSTITTALTDARLTPEQISAVGVGIAGAPSELAKDWLLETVSAVLPQSVIVPSSDQEIALMGALGQRHGILLLAGTGSLAFGVHPNGATALAGGWGYLLGDEGGGYWLAIEAMKAVIREFEGHGTPTELTPRLLEYMQLPTPFQFITWLYPDRHPSEVAQLTPLILATAEQGDAVALDIIHRAVDALYLLATNVQERLNYSEPPYAFTGGLLEHDNLLSTALWQRLDLEARPLALYRPVIGAVLLAKEATTDGNS